MNFNHLKLTGLLLSMAALPGVAVAAGADPLEPGDLLGTTGQDDKLILIDTQTGAGFFHAGIGTFGPVTDIVFCQGAFIGSVGDGRSVLINMNPETGDEELRCNHLEGAVTALECVGNTLFGAYIPGADELSVLMDVGFPDDNDQCSLTPVGPGVNGTTGFRALGGMAYDPITARMYGCVTRFEQPSTGPLILLDLGTGAGTPVGDTGLSRCGALAFDTQPPGPEGIDLPLYAGTGTQDALPGALFEIFEQTGASNFIGYTGFDGLSGLAFVPGPPDADEDGIPDFQDNCIFVFNPGQQDTNGDGFGNACDTDLDNDCVTNFGDLALFKAAFLAEPGDPNWNPDADFNSDLMINFGDLARVKQYFVDPPGPSGVPNDCSPNLQVRLINPPTTVACPGGQGTCVHDVDLEVLERNGQPVDEPFEVTVFTDSGLSATFGVPPLPPGAVVPFGVTLGPGDNCYNPDCEVTAEVDSGAVVTETDETDNTDTRLDIG